MGKRAQEEDMETIVTEGWKKFHSVPNTEKKSAGVTKNGRVSRNVLILMFIQRWHEEDENKSSGVSDITNIFDQLSVRDHV